MRTIKVWQDTGWEKRIKELQGNSLKVLWHLVHVAGWNNQIPGPTEVATCMGLRQPNVSHAYAELVKTDFLYRISGSYRLNPYFCWKGDDEQYEQACRELLKQVPRLQEGKDARTLPVPSPVLSMR